MRRTITPWCFFLILPLLLTGCHSIGDKAESIGIIYLIALVLSLLLLVGYVFAVKKKELWYLLLFSSVLVVNTGYFVLSISGTLEVALHANRLAYFGSVFLPLSMWMIILNETHTTYRKWLPISLFAVAVLIFFIAASPGYLNIYYKDVSLITQNGVSALKKEYGPLHILYLIYLMGYFAAMVITIIHAAVLHKVKSPVHIGILIIAVFINVGLWLIEQLVELEFEVLSVSYIISECFLLGLHLLVAEHEKEKNALIQQPPQNQPVSASLAEPSEEDRVQLTVFTEGLTRLTPKEKEIYESYVQGMTTAQIMETLQIKENTLKFHNKNLYGKLGVSSRKRLLYYAAMVAQDTENEKNEEL